METVYVDRDASGVIRGVYAIPQDNATEALPGDSAEVAAFLDPPPPPVQTVTPRQARLALFAAGLLDQVEAAVASAGGATKITWDYATVINRADPLITTLGASLNLTSAQIDALFTQAATL